MWNYRVQVKKPRKETKKDILVEARMSNADRDFIKTTLKNALVFKIHYFHMNTQLLYYL